MRKIKRQVSLSFSLEEKNEKMVPQSGAFFIEVENYIAQPPLTIFDYTSSLGGPLLNRACLSGRQGGEM